MEDDIATSEQRAREVSEAVAELVTVTKEI